MNQMWTPSGCDTDDICANWQQIQCIQQIVLNVLSQGIPGVTDGSLAKAGMVGERIQQSSSGTFTGNPYSTVVPAVTVPAGDWSIQAQLAIADTSSAGGYFYEGLLELLGPTNNILGTSLLQVTPMANNGFAAINANTQVFPFNVSVPTIISAQIKVVGYAPTTPGNWAIAVYGRRVR